MTARLHDWDPDGCQAELWRVVFRHSDGRDAVLLLSRDYPPDFVDAYAALRAAQGDHPYEEKDWTLVLIDSELF